LGRQWALTAVFLVALAVLGWQIWFLNRAFAVTIAPDDFVQYWAAGRLGWAGENFYDPQRMLPLEREVGWSESRPLMMYAPPYSWPIIAPWSLMGYAPARLLWFAFHAALLLIGADWLWRFYGGRVTWRWLSWLLLATFLPAIIVARIGQITPLIFIGAVIFLVSAARGAYFTAGAAVLLIALKPQLFYLFWPALLFWIVQERQWRVVAGATAVGGLALGATMAFNPAILLQFLQFSLAEPPAHYAPPTLGMAFRFLFGLELFWLQFVPVLFGLVWFLFYWRRQRRAWDWTAAMPLLTAVSLATTAYGWTYDQILLLIPIMQTAVWFTADGRRPSVWLFTSLYGVVLLCAWALNAGRVHDFYYFWLPLVLTLLYLWARRAHAVKPASPLSIAPNRGEPGSRPS
jgi:hypothetical protein